MHQDNIDNDDYNKLSFNQLNISPWNDTGMLLGKLTSNISELLKNQENNNKSFHQLLWSTETFVKK